MNESKHTLGPERTKDGIGTNSCIVDTQVLVVVALHLYHNPVLRLLGLPSLVDLARVLRPIHSKSSGIIVDVSKVTIRQNIVGLSSERSGIFE